MYTNQHTADEKLTHVIPTLHKYTHMLSNDSNIMVSSQFFILKTLKQLEFLGGLLCLLFDAMCLKKIYVFV